MKRPGMSVSGLLSERWAGFVKAGYVLFGSAFDAGHHNALDKKPLAEEEYDDNRDH